MWTKSFGVSCCSGYNGKNENREKIENIWIKSRACCTQKPMWKKRQLGNSCWGSVALIMLTKQKLVKTIILPSRLGVGLLHYFVSFPSFTAGYRVRERWQYTETTRNAKTPKSKLGFERIPTLDLWAQRHSYIYLREVCSSSFKEKSQFTDKIQVRTEVLMDCRREQRYRYNLSPFFF